MADNYNLSVTASALNTAITKANAAAPQSTTYTKAQTDAAIASSVAPSTSALTSLINSGAKNIADTSKVVLQQTAPELTFTLTDDIYSIVGTANPEATAYRFENVYYKDTNTVMIPPGEYTAQVYPANASVRLAAIVSGSAVVRGSVGEAITFTVPDDATNSWLRVETAPGTVLDWQFRLMIAPKDQYAISSEFVPYTPTLSELYEMVKALQNS